jgi:ABC-type branched-subunit amino acid transport system substrate-binding protein
MKRIFFILLAITALIAYFINSDRKSYLIASSLPLEGIMKNIGTSVKMGTFVSYKFCHKHMDKKLKYIFKDDKYEPQLTYDNIMQLYKLDSFLFYGIVGTPTVKKILPFLNSHSIYLYAPFTGAMFLRKDKYVLNFRASYKDELKHIISYLLSKNIKKISVFYQNDEYGNQIYFYTYEILKKHGIKLTSTGTYRRNTFIIDSAINEIFSSKPQAIIMGSTSEVSAMFIKKYRKKDKNVIFCTISFVNPDALIQYLKNSKNIIFSEVVPYYKDNKIPVARAFLREFKMLYPNKKPSFFAFEAYLANKILLRAFKKLSFPYTPGHLIDIIKHTPRNYLKGITIDYKNNQLLNETYLFVYKNGKFKELK